MTLGWDDTVRRWPVVERGTVRTRTPSPTNSSCWPRPGCTGGPGWSRTWTGPGGRGTGSPGSGLINEAGLVNDGLDAQLPQQRPADLDLQPGRDPGRPGRAVAGHRRDGPAGHGRRGWPTRPSRTFYRWTARCCGSRTAGRQPRTATCSRESWPRAWPGCRGRPVARPAVRDVPGRATPKRSGAGPAAPGRPGLGRAGPGQRRHPDLGGPVAGRGGPARRRTLGPRARPRPRPRGSAVRRDLDEHWRSRPP